MGVGVTITALVVLLVAACAGSPNGRPAPSSTPQVSVDGPLLISERPLGEGSDAVVRGTLSYEGGCLRLDGRLVVWPKGTSWDEQNEQVVLPDGSVARPGSRVHGGGGYDHAGLRNVGNEEAEALLRRCPGETSEVAIFNAGSRVRVD